MPDTNTLTDLLGEPRPSIISTWDIVVTPSLSVSLARAEAEQPEDVNDGLVHAVTSPGRIAYALGEIATLKANLSEQQERFIRCAAYRSPHEAVLEGQPWLERALEGHTRYRDTLAPFIWRSINTSTATDWEIAERIGEPLRLVKQARLVKNALIGRGLHLPASWCEALDLAAHKAPEAFSRTHAIRRQQAT
ncbi:hypothetical protein [Salipiger mucosus]|uniref:hypothetical protein n=1 Tax=Salipiger mucosus TaxID=263378 RepID=UPI00035F8C05|nr:hypothetical protein [Salipiger mucosus]